MKKKSNIGYRRKGGKRHGSGGMPRKHAAILKHYNRPGQGTEGYPRTVTFTRKHRLRR